MSSSRRYLRVVRAALLPCLILTGMAVAAYAIGNSQEIAPPKAFTTANDFLTRGYLLNGEIVVTSPVKTLPSLTGPIDSRSGRDIEGFIARARLTDPLVGLGDFQIHHPMTLSRQGAGTVLARGPALEEVAGIMPPPNDALSYLYIVGGVDGGGVLGSIERAYIDADGNVHPGLETSPVGSLTTPRYGAAVVARDDFIYVIGGYDKEHMPLDGIERFKIGPFGQLGPSTNLAGPGHGGDVAAVIANGYLYVIGGNALPRGPDEQSTNAVSRAPIDPRGNLGSFEAMDALGAELPAKAAGGRAFVIAAMTPDPVYYIYYLGGNVGNLQAGATTNVYRLKLDPVTNAYSTPWESLEIDGDLVQLKDPRELFAAVVTNGFVYVIGGETTALGQTTYYSTVERAAVKADGSIGQFSRLEEPNATYINGLDRASDINGVAFNNSIYVPGGRDDMGNALDVVFQLDLDQPGALLDSTVPDAAVLDPIHDMTRDMEIDSLTFGIQPDTEFPEGAQFRFRWAADLGSWSDWSGYFPIGRLPADLDVLKTLAGNPAVHVLDLSYPKGAATACSAEVIPNPTGFSGPIVARYLEYEVVMPSGGKDQKFNDLTINAHPMMHFALPGGYDPTYAGQTHPPSCGPGNAIADAGTEGWVRFSGAGFPAGISAGQLRFVSSDVNAPSIEIISIDNPDTSTLDMKVAIGGGSGGGPFDYSLLFNPELDPAITVNERTLMSTAIKVHPAIRMDGAPLPALDVNLSTTATMENVLEAPDSATGRTAFPVAVSGFNIRSGRVNDSGPVAVDDPTSSSHWPENPIGGSEQPPVLRYKLSDLSGNAAGFSPLKLEGVNPGEWVEVQPSQVKSPQRFDISLEVPHAAMSGPHALELTVQNPQLGSVTTVKQTVYIVPAFAVDAVVTRLDPRPDPNPAAVNNYDWSGAYNPAMADLGDGYSGPELKIGLNGYGFQSDQGKTALVLGASYDLDLNEIGPFASGLTVTDPKALDVTTLIPSNGTTGLHRIELTWSYDPAADGYLAGEHVPPNPGTAMSRQWPVPATSQWQGLYVAPARAKILTLMGAANTQDPIVLLESDPTLTVNGEGFGIGGPITHGFDTALCTARLMSLSNSPNEDIQVPTTGLHMISDGQARLTMPISSTQRAGEMYQLEICTSLGLPDTSKVRLPYTSSLSQQMVTVLPLPQCAAVSGTSCFAVKQGGTLDSVTLTGQNFDTGTKVHLGADVTVTVLSVCNDNANCPTEDVLTFKVEVSPQAVPGPRTLEIENGPTSSLSQKASCSQQFDFWVVPVPSVSKIQPSLIQMPPMSVGSKIVPIDIYGANFMPGTTVVPTPATGVTVAGPVVVVDSGHITTELRITDAAAAGDVTLNVNVPSGPACMTEPQKASSTFAITSFPELSISAVANSAPSQCQGRSGVLTVTGANFKDPATGASLVASASLGTDVSIDALTITSPTALTVSYTINDNAAPGKRALTLHPIAQGATPAVFADTLTITTSPAIFSVSPQTLQGGATREFTIGGRNFYEPGADITVEPPDNVKVISPTVKSTGQITVTLQADATAGSLMRSIVVTNSDGGQCNVAKLSSALRVIPEISITAVSNSTPSQCQGRSGALTVTGVNFKDSMSGAALVGSASLGADVSIDSLVIASATSLTVNYTINDNAAVGVRPLTLLPILQGASNATHAGAMTITSSPSIISISPQTVQRGSTRTFTLSGRNFLPGAGVTVEPSADVTVTDVTVVNGGQILVTLEIGASAALDSRAIVVHNGGGGTCSDVAFNAAVRIFDPPHVTNMRFSDGNLKITGTNFHTSIKAFIGASTTPWAKTALNKSHTTFTLKKVKSVFPKGVEVTVRLLNTDDGGETTFVFTR